MGEGGGIATIKSHFWIVLSQQFKYVLQAISVHYSLMVIVSSLDGHFGVAELG